MIGGKQSIETGTLAPSRQVGPGLDVSGIGLKGNIAMRRQCRS